MTDAISQRVDELSRRWDNQMQRKNMNDRTVYLKPQILLALYGGKWYTTIEDNKSISFFLSDQKQVFAGATFKCEPYLLDTGRRVYNITRPDTLQIVSCAKGTSLSPISDFVADNIV